MSSTAVEVTLCIIKPDAMRNGHPGKAIQRIVDEGFSILALTMIQLSSAEAAGFYAVHRERPFFQDLIEKMTAGPVIVAALERQDAVSHWRKVIGATDPAQAAVGTLRQQLGESLSCNAVHGSDSAANGLRETAFFFTGAQLGR